MLIKVYLWGNESKEERELILFGGRVIWVGF